LASLDPGEQAKLGQFFTPTRAAELIASMVRLPKSGSLRVLDPGAGVGSLTAALVERVAREAPAVALDIVAVELDPKVVPYLRQTLDDCAGPTVRCRLVEGDFITGSSGGLDGLDELRQPFDLVVMNPPYAKLGATSEYRRALQLAGVQCPNLYAAFLALGYMNLVDGGQVVAIIPRSFANGTYFSDFRRHLLAATALDRIHTFESRSTVFADTGVLQENVIISAIRGGTFDSVLVTSSVGHEDQLVERVVPTAEVVKPSDPHRFVRIALDDAALPDAAGCLLADLGLTASTGRVVDFRARQWLVDAEVEGSVPLVYPGNVRFGRIEWPRAIRKAQGFLAGEEAARRQLVPPGSYVVIKRFSSKEERRRVVAAVWESPTPVAFENHLNVIHRDGRGLDGPLAAGLCIWLNSTAIDRYFRTFSGHTQVNATDLRTLPMPSVEDLRRLGSSQQEAMTEQEEIDGLVDAVLGDKMRAA
jgi:adenine-specific DNA-methyltransferase